MGIYNSYTLGGRVEEKSPDLTPEQNAAKQGALDLPFPMIDQGLDTLLNDTTKLESLRSYEGDRGSALGTAVSQDNLVGSVATWAKSKIMWNDATMPPEEGFSMKDHRWAYGMVHRDYWDDINQSESLPELQARVSYYGKLTKDQETLDNLGIEGTGYRLGAFLGDVPLLNGISKLSATGKLGKTLEGFSKSYAGRALITGGLEGGFEAAKYAMNATEREEVDILLAMGIGGVLGGFYNPLKYTDNMDAAITTKVREQVDEIATTGTVQAPKATETIMDKLQVNVASILRKAPSPTLQKWGDDMFNDVMNPTAITKHSEAQTAVIDGVQSAFSRNFYGLYLDFLKENGKGTLFSRFRTGSQNDFHEMVGDIVYNPNSPWRQQLSAEFITKVENAVGKMGEDSFDILYRAKHPMFRGQGISKTSGWMPRRWNKDKIRDMLNTGAVKREDMVALFSKSIRNTFDEAGIKVADDRVKEAAESFVTSLSQKPMRSGEAGYITQQSAYQDMMGELRTYMNLTDDEVEYIFSQLNKKSSKKGTAASTKGRADLDLGVSVVTKNGSTLHMHDLLEKNIQNLWHGYGRTMGGDTALRLAGIDSPNTLAKLRETVVKELSGTDGQIIAGNEKYLSLFDATVGDLLGMSAKADPAGDLWKISRSINNLTRSAKLGGTWWAMSAELAQTAHTVGIVNAFKALPVLRQMVKQLRGKNSGALLEEIQAWDALGIEFMNLPSIARLDELYTSSSHAGRGRLSKTLNSIEGFSDKAAEAAFILGGSKSGTAMLEALFAVGHRIKLTKLANKQRLSQFDKYYLKKFGWDEATSKQILENIRTHGSKDPNNRYMLNLDAWDVDLAQQFSYGTRRQSHTAIQKGNIGDELGIASVDGQLVKDNHIGALAVNLRNYMIRAWNKQTGRMYNQGARALRNKDLAEGWDVFSNVLMQGVVVGGLGYMGKTGLDYALGAIDDKKFDERMTPQAIAANTFSMTTFASFLPTVLEYPYQAATGERLAGSGVRGGQFTINPLGASGSYIADVSNIPYTAIGLLSPERDVSAYELRRTIGTLPISTAIGVKQLQALAAEGLSETD